MHEPQVREVNGDSWVVGAICRLVDGEGALDQRTHELYEWALGYLVPESVASGDAGAKG
jgi:hypothetical protein